MFKKLNGDVAILRRNGTYFQGDLYEFEGCLFAKVAGGFIRLRKNGTTTRENTVALYLESNGPIYFDKFGRLTTKRDDAHEHQLDIARFNSSGGLENL